MSIRHIPSIQAFSALLIAMALTAGLASRARAQCETLVATQPRAGLDGRPMAQTTWDPDGPGPLGQLLVVAGSFETAGPLSARSIAAWNGTEWSRLGTLFESSLPSVSLLSVTTWDPDGDGPQGPWLVVGGRFDRTVNGIRYVNAAAYDGASWHPLGVNLPQNASSLTSWDADGEGPEAPRLVAAVASSPSGCVFVWDQTTWNQMAPEENSPSEVRALATFDFDGPGGQPPVLLMAGWFYGNDQYSSGVTGWNGTNWVRLENPELYRGESITTHDPDGAGPLPAELWVGAQSFTSLAFKRVGDQWETIPLSGSISPVKSLASFDADGLGPAPASLVLGGGPFTIAGSSYYAATWDGSVLRGIGTAVLVGQNSPSAYLLTACEGWGGNHPLLVVGGSMRYLESDNPADVPFEYVGTWNGSAWGQLSPGAVTDSVRGVEAYDPDGRGPRPTQALVRGTFTAFGGVRARDAALWDGQSFRAIGDSRTTLSLSSTTVWDPDGDGPGQPLLVASGTFASIAGVPAASIAAWNGDAWTALGLGLNGRATVLTSHDPDGPGPLPPLLIAAGSFTSAGGNAAPGLAAWDGAGWSAVGSGGVTAIKAMQSIDLDAEGPASPSLVVAGTFGSVPGLSGHRIGAWNGQQWSAVGGWLNGAVTAIASWDADGNGPAPARLVAGGLFTLAGSDPVVGTALFDGARWVQMGSPVTNIFTASNHIRTFHQWDPDGDGPRRPELLAAGGFLSSGNVSGAVLRWTGARWARTIAHSLGGPASGVGVDTLAVIDLDGDGPALPRLWIGGDFTRLGNSGTTAGLIEWVDVDTASISADPEDATSFLGYEAAFSAAAISDLPLTYSWSRNGIALVDGPTPTGSIVAGATTPDLHISLVSTSDEGDYACMIASTCSIVDTSAAQLRVACPADFDLSGGVDGADVEAFFGAWERGDSLADINQDGGVDGGDIEAFFRVWESGGC